MLLRLAIRDFVIVDRVELDFRPGFTVLSGETGAGKSILIDALGLLMGDKGDGSLVRQGQARAELEAEFDTAGDADIAAWLEEQGLPGEEQTILLRRIIDSSRSRVFINGAGATLAQLKDLGERLVDIHGQHAHQSLMRADPQRQLLDAYAGHGEAVKQLKVLFHDWQQAREQWQRWQTDAAELAAQREAWAWQAQELGALAPQDGEWAELNSEHQRLTHSVDLIRGAQTAVNLLLEDDTAAMSTLNAALQQVSELKDIDARLEEPWTTLNAVAENIHDVARTLRQYADRVEVDPDRLDELDQRLSSWLQLARKYRLPPEELPQYWQTVQDKLAQLEAGSDAAALEQRLASCAAAYQQLAQTVSVRRQQAAETLASKVTAELAELAMGNHRFAVALTPTAQPTAAGLEAVELQISPHSSMPLRSLAKTASGGELSRISLAIQVVTAQVAAVPTLIFDEVDVGIGGRVAEIVGRKLRLLGGNYQVLCITHLPQVAAHGHQHWQVVKEMRSDGVFSNIAVLNGEQRTLEIARMLGGVDITETTRRHAQELLQHSGR